ncbi:MAG: hypothetical protein ACFFFG_14945 [Candidatus Thorarchaeota archaeon]
MPEYERVVLRDAQILFQYERGAEVAQTLPERMCQSYKRIWDQIPKVFADIRFELQCDRPPKGTFKEGQIVFEGTIDCEPVIIRQGCRTNQYAYEVLENARRWGCPWVAEATAEMARYEEQCGRAVPR